MANVPVDGKIGGNHSVKDPLQGYDPGDTGGGGLPAYPGQPGSNDLNWLSMLAFAGPNVRSGVVPTGDLNGMAAVVADQQLTVAAANAPLRIIYGEVLLGAQIANVLTYNNGWAIQCVWGEGEIGGIQQPYYNGKTALGATACISYNGTASQTADYDLVQAFAQNGFAYADALPGVAYSVVVIPQASNGLVQGFPQISARIHGIKLYDPRLDSTNGGSGAQSLADPATWTWSANPALALANFLSNATYGMKRQVNWASVIAAANACDDPVNGEPRRKIGLALDSTSPCSSWLDTLRTYAGCWVFMDGGVATLVPNRPRSTDASFDHASGQIKAISKLTKRGVQQIPTTVEIRYTDTSKVPWQQASQWAYEAGVLAGTTPRRETQVALPGIQSASQALREATERLNQLWLCDLSFTLEVFDDGLKYQIGDVVSVTHPIGLSGKLMRVTSVAGDYGRYQLGLIEYDPAVYSDAIASNPTYPDTNLPDPANLPAVTGLALSETVYQLENGAWASRIAATWNALAVPFVFVYRVEVWSGAALIYTTTSATTAANSPPVQEGVAYTIKVYAQSSTGSLGASASASLTAQGKQMPPSNIPSISAYEVGGEVHVTLGAATDLDMLGYEVRYGAPGVAWSSAIFLAFANAASGVGAIVVSKDVPTGTWDVLACALDSVRQYSPTPARASLVVTSDSNAFLAGSYTFASPTLTNMLAYGLPGDPNTYYVTDDGVAAATKFPSSPASGYTDIAANYGNTVVSTFVTEAHDFGISLSGNWQASLTSAVLNSGGAKNDFLELSANGSTYLDNPLAIKAAGRFAKLKSTAPVGSVLKVTQPSAAVNCKANTLDRGGQATSSASAPTPIILPDAFSKAVSCVVTPIGTAAMTGTPNRIALMGAAPFAGRSALQFNGSSNYVSVSDYSALRLTSGTIEFMAWIDVTPAGDTPLCGKFDSGGGNNYNFYGAYLTPVGKIKFYVPGASVFVSFTGSRIINDASWHRVSIVFSLSSIAIYIDGALDNSTTVAASGAAPAGPFGIGASYWPSTSVWTYFSNSRIADVRIWNTQRSAIDIANAAFATLAGNEAGLVGYWPLNDQSGSSAANLVSGGNNGTLTNSPLWSGINGFDAYVFNQAGAQIANSFMWSFKGV